MTNVGVIVSDEIQFNAENKENDKDTKKLTSKRKMSQPLTGSKRFCFPRYIEDLRRKDFTSDRNWQIVYDYIHNSKNKHRILKQKIKCLSKKVENLQSLLEHLKKNGLLSNEVCNALEVSCSFI